MPPNVVAAAPTMQLIPAVREDFVPPLAMSPSSVSVADLLAATLGTRSRRVICGSA